MAKWTVTSATAPGSLVGGIEYDRNTKESHWQVYQDEQPFIDQAKRDREADKKKDSGFKKFATIPEIVAIEIKDKYGIDIHDPTFFHDVDKKARFMTIIKQEFPYLLSY